MVCKRGRTLAGLPDELVGEFHSQQGVTELETLDDLATFGDSPVRCRGPFAAAFATGGEAVTGTREQTVFSSPKNALAMDR